MAILLICNSNLFVPTVLSLIKEDQGNQYIVISDTENIGVFFKSLAISNVFFLHYKQPSKWDIYRRRKSFFQELLSHRIDKVFFFHTEFGGIVNWLIKFLSSSIPIYYCKIFEKLPNKKARISYMSVKMWILEYLKTHVSMEILDTGYRLIPSLPNTFYKDVKAKTITVQLNQDNVSKYVHPLLRKYDIERCKCILLTGSAVPTGLVDETEYTTQINIIISAIGISNVLSKSHPRFNNQYGLENKLGRIPSFIPGNVIINNYDFYLGLESSLLVEAALEGKMSISLIDIMNIPELIKEDIRSFFASRLQNKAEILFPQSVDELINLIN